MKSNELKELVKKIKYLTNKTSEDIANEIGYSRSYFTVAVNSGENDVIKQLLLTKFKTVIEQNVPRNTLNEPNATYVQKRRELKNLTKPTIPIYESIHTLSNMEVFNDDAKQTPDFWITIPQLRDCDFGCRASGQSMYPLIQSNALVIGRHIKDISVIVYGEIYIVHTRNGLQTIKYVQQSEKGEQWLKLVPYNEKATITEIKKSDILRLYEVKAYFNML